MQIQELERRVNMDRASIRYYESEGLITPKRLSNGYRDYSEQDADMLLKIKFLRQLDISIANIRRLQNGDVTLHQLLSDSTAYRQIQEANAAEAVRREMISDKVSFDRLDISYYSRRFRTAQEPISQSTHVNPSPETVNYPFRRYFAKIIDRFLVLCVLECLLLCVFRLRPIDHWLYLIAGILAVWLTIPLEALQLHWFGTTVGKWIFGIYITDWEQGKLHFAKALSRAFSSFHYGEGFQIPIYGQIRMIITAVHLWKRYDMQWDYDCALEVREWSLKRALVLLTVAVAAISMTVLISNEQFLPRYITPNPTVAQFLENMECYRKGTKVVNAEGEEVLSNGIPDFTYDLSEGHITAIHYRHTDGYVFAWQTIPSRCESAAYAIVGGQPGMTKAKMEQFAQLYQSYLYGTDIPSNGRFEFENITIIWNISKADNLFEVSFDILIGGS